ncbi:MAG: hypothetical protein ACI4M6_07005 [Christensenellaceae bacterium]
MGSFFRRAVSFTLGAVFGITATVGGVAGGAFWAYKNVRPVEKVAEKNNVEGLGDIETASVEELLNLLASAIENPDEYTINRLEQEYKVDLNAFLLSIGINPDDTNEEDIEALKQTPIFSVTDGLNELFKGMKFRALYVFAPKILGKSIDDLLSKEAQEKLGEYTVYSIMEKDPVTGELGIMKALKTLKIGSLMPKQYDAAFNADKHEYIYVPKTENEALKLMANVYIGTIFDIIKGRKITDEIVEGGLKSIGEMPLKEFLASVFGLSGALTESLERKLDACGDLLVKDLFVEAEGGYVMSYEKLEKELKVGYLFNNYLGQDGNWYTDKDCTVPATGVAKALSEINLYELMQNKDDRLEMLNSVFGPVTFGELLQSVGSTLSDTAGAQALYSITVSQVLKGKYDSIFKNILDAVSVSLGDISFGEVLGFNSDNPLVNALYGIKVGQLLKPDLKEEDALNVIQGALGAITLGNLLGYERDENNDWICENNVYKVLLDYSFDNVFNAVNVRENKTEVIKALFADYTFGDFFGAMYGYEYDEAVNNYKRVTVEESQNEDTGEIVATEKVEYLDAEFADFLTIKIGDAITHKDATSSFNLYERVKGLSLGEISYSVLQARRKLPPEIQKISASEYQYITVEEDGYVSLVDDYRQVSEILFQIDFEEYATHRTDKQYWIDKFVGVKNGTIFFIFMTEEQENENALFKAMLNLSYEDIINLVTCEKKVDMAEIITANFSTVEINGELKTIFVSDLLELAFDNWQGKVGFKAFGNIEFAPFVNSMLGAESKKAVFGHVTLHDMIDGFNLGRFNDSKFVDKSLNVTLGELAEIARSRAISQSFHEILEPLYEDLTIGECINDFYKGFADKEEIQDFMSITVAEFLHSAHTKDLGVFVEKAKACYSQLSREEKVAFLGCGACFAGAMYMFDDAMLLKLINATIGNDTWGDHLASRLGFTFDGERYTLDGIYNPMADRLLKEQVNFTFDKSKCSIKEEYIKVANVGNFVVSYKKIVNYVNKIGKELRLGKLASNAEGEIYFDGSFERITLEAMSLKPYDIYKNRNGLKSFIKAEYGDLLVGDFVAPFVRKGLRAFGFDYSYSVTSQGYTASGSFINLTEKGFNVTLNEAYSNRNNLKAYVKDFVGELNVGDFTADFVNVVGEKYASSGYSGNAVLSEDKSSWTVEGDYDEFLSIMYNMNVRWALGNVKHGVKSFIAREDVFGNVRIGYAFNRGRYYYDEVENKWYYADGSEMNLANGEGRIKEIVFSTQIKELAGADMFATMMNKVKALELGYVLNYSLDETDAENPVWKDAHGFEVSALLGKLAGYTVAEIQNDMDGIMDDIINDLTLGEVVSESVLNGNGILVSVQDCKISELATAVNNMSIGSAMGYEKKSDGLWYDDAGLVVRDEILSIIAEYKIGNLTGDIALESGKTFTEDLVDNMVENVSISTIYPDAGREDADGFMALIEADWKVNELADNLMTKLKTTATINQLIKLGVFGDFFELEDGQSAYNAPAYVEGERTNFGKIDKMMTSSANKINPLTGYKYGDADMDGTVTESEVRSYWLTLTMPKFMDNMMNKLVEYQNWMDENRELLESLGITPIQ